MRPAPKASGCITQTFRQGRRTGEAVESSSREDSWKAGVGVWPVRLAKRDAVGREQLAAGPGFQVRIVARSTRELQALGIWFSVVRPHRKTSLEPSRAPKEREKERPRPRPQGREGAKNAVQLADRGSVPALAARLTTLTRRQGPWLRHAPHLGRLYSRRVGARLRPSPLRVEHHT